ncbi:hypothetical protein C8R32_10426 [Nitrosospira sp. Nsp5]|uniref:Uncharacterized protein n=1 Tax=Nitrosospira multiformis TaxID=1231 RepID=A0ABY0TDN8_9PROT|nr:MULTISPECIES: hypothetical protein [Nitrosospira]PTR08947.1 hypothetical protein C8R32_10426 [Nitrosospira sp. Nsp5]SDQ67562.1 hypothetical protein SAMN05216402_1805 [Nitrosospira multiformis]
MRRKIIPGRLAIAIACMRVFAAQAASTWDESTIDDLSNDGLLPTHFAMTIGSNNVIGITGNGGGDVDRDYSSFTVPNGAALTATSLLSNAFVSGSSSFIGIRLARN